MLRDFYNLFNEENTFQVVQISGDEKTSVAEDWPVWGERGCYIKIDVGRFQKQSSPYTSHHATLDLGRPIPFTF